MNTNLRTQSSPGHSVEPERMDTKRRHSEVQNGASQMPLRINPPVMRNFDHVRENIVIYSQGIFNTTYNHDSKSIRCGPTVPELPPRDEFARLSRSYLASIHEWYPIVHWPTVQHESNKIYTSGSLEGVSKEWAGLFFAILACGCLQGSGLQHGPASAEGKAFFEVAAELLTPWPYEFAIEHVQAAFLLSFFATENNWRSVGSMWLSSAVRAAQELSIHCDSKAGSAVDVEVRRRLWWALYVRDR